ncbi:MAG: ATP-dependent DNA helicase RecG [Planctomycetes bacterium]|jgi:ATP-dependent DNA helicase RecG|nr:ATP-dependent DNA helicase RecG [Planctomycetota bacterium]
MITLDTDVSQISRVGKTTANRLKMLGIATVRDLLLFFPFRYEDFRAQKKITDLQPGDETNITGSIEIIQNRRSPRKRMYITEALINDGTDTIKVIWFNQPFIAKSLKIGDRVSLAGKIEGETGSLLMLSPQYEKIGAGISLHTQGLVPMYHLTANITQKQVRFLIGQTINLANSIKDWLPTEMVKRQKLMPLATAIKKIHFPKNFKEIEQARQRLAFNELFLLQLQSVLSKLDRQASLAEPIQFKEKLTKDFVDLLPFSLTDAQKKTAWQIIQDIGKKQPMSRLLEGDVGSGKTIVALLAMLNTAANGKQSVLMVPTEILAKQHYDNFCKLLDKKYSLCLLTHSQFSIFNPEYSGQFSNKEKINKKIVLNSIAAGEIKIIIGTHSLIQEDVNFKNLCLAIIDEQHRFGVEQRKTLIEKSCNNIQNSKLKIPNCFSPHFLSMTATPIPRTLALALYGDLDLSVINEMPKNRKPILTKVVPETNRQLANDFIRQQIKNGRQVFVICPLIDLSDKLGVKSVKEEFLKLDKTVFPDLKIGLLHGRMKNKEKEAVMQSFLDNETKILVSTAVVEVGVDVPNATVMMIEGAERFGLAQLHQFRGRVGRSEHQSYCFLFTETATEKTIRRLQALVGCQDGFALARMDLKFRGPGEIFGTAQKGFPELKIATLFDYVLMQRARKEAEDLIGKDRRLADWPELKKQLAPLNNCVHVE